MPSWFWSTLRKTSGLGNAVSGSRVIILQRGSRSRTEITTLEPIRTLRPTSAFSEKPLRAREVQIEVCPEAPLVEDSSDFITESLGGLYGKERDRAAVGHAA